MAIVDTDFLSSFFKIGKLGLILKALNLKQVIVPSTVYEELKEAEFFPKIISFFAFQEEELSSSRFILVKEIKLNELTRYFAEETTQLLGQGERGCFLLAKESRDLILIDDQKARAMAQELQLKVLSIPAFLWFCKKRKIISVEEIKELMNDLKEKDYYEFSEEVKEVLLEEILK